MINFYEYPQAASLQTYDDAIRRMTDALMALPQVMSVYQIGSVSTRGISDIDMVVVFKEGEHYGLNPLTQLEGIQKYLFVHSLFGISEKRFATINSYLPSLQYNFIAGKKIQQNISNHSAQDLEKLNHQVALEYLLKNFITASVQRKIGIVKLRQLLLEVNALKYDFELLGITQGKLFELVHELIDWRKKWFTSPPAISRINNWFNEYHEALYKLLQELFQKYSLYVPVNPPIALMRNASLMQGKEFKVTKSGISLPMIPGIKTSTLFKVGSRLNSFRFELPMKTPEEKSIHALRFTFLKELRTYNNAYLPYFTPMVSVLPII